SDAQIQWNGVPLKTIVISTGEATALIPAASVSALGSAAITVLSGSTTSNSMSLSIVGGDPVINTLLPAVVMEGGTGFTLTLMGSGFTDDAVVQWNSTALATTYATSEQLSAAVPASLITNPGSISVTVLIDGTASSAVVFTIADQTATIGSLQPPVALAGGSDVQLTIDGVGFAQGDSVQWNGTKLTTTFDSTEQLTATVPSSLLTQAGTATVTVLSGTTTSNAANFTVIVPQPAIGLLEPSTVIAGAAQFTLTVTGGFGAGDFALQMVAAPELQSFTL
ncbi:MAG: IPT/TIG domain-containing protein, partial [Bacteroidia bacterium]|nr:IPT/TIG domain-containing protein [Bacteroidia bacterium]